MNDKGGDVKTSRIGSLKKYVYVPLCSKHYATRRLREVNEKRQ